MHYTFCCKGEVVTEKNKQTLQTDFYLFDLDLVKMNMYAKIK